MSNVRQLLAVLLSFVVIFDFLVSSPIPLGDPRLHLKRKFRSSLSVIGFSGKNKYFNNPANVEFEIVLTRADGSILRRIDAMANRPAYFAPVLDSVQPHSRFLKIICQRASRVLEPVPTEHINILRRQRSQRTLRDVGPNKPPLVEVIESC
jgi:hypothetical protein